MRMKDEPEVEEEEEEEEEEEKEKERDERGDMETGSSRLQQETELEEAVQDTRPPTDLMCSKETKTHGNIFLLLPLVFSRAFSLIVHCFEKPSQFLLVHFDSVALDDM